MGFSNNLTQKTDFDLGSDLRVRLGVFPYMLALHVIYEANPAEHYRGI